MIDLQNKIKIQGAYRAVISRGGNVVKETDWCDNVITNYGLANLACYDKGLGNYISFCRVGTGTSVPSYSNTVLDAQIGSTAEVGAISHVNKGAPNYEAEVVYRAIFAQGAVVGNITEVSMARTATGSDVVSRTLFTDSNDNPITLTITAIDQLTIFYKITVPHPNINETSGAFNISGEVYNYIARPCHVASFNMSEVFRYGIINRAADNALAYNSGFTLPVSITDGPGGNQTGFDKLIETDYNIGDLENTIKIEASINYANHVGGIHGFRFAAVNKSYYLAVKLDKPIMKTNTNVLKMSYKFSWGR